VRRVDNAARSQLAVIRKPQLDFPGRTLRRQHPYPMLQSGK
jgi:hypothetical protein